MLERQREGVAKAKSAGKYKGRKPIAPERRQEVLRLAAQGDGTRLAIWVACIGLADFLAWRLERVHGLSSAQEGALREPGGRRTQR